MAPPRVGQLREYIGLQAPADVTTSAGRVVNGWATAVNVWARVAPLTAGQVIRQDQKEAAIVYIVTIRRRTVAAGWRVVWGSVKLKVEAVVDQDERRRHLELRCSTVGPETE